MLKLVEEQDVSFFSGQELEIFAKTLWGESLGEAAGTREAIACTILNRVEIAEDRGTYWWGNNVIQVCQKPYQFSCWDRGHRDYHAMRSIDESDTAYKECVAIAKKALTGSLRDMTRGSTKYHSIRDNKPFWSKGETPKAQVGNLLFY